MNSYEKTELIQYFVSESQRKQNTIDDLMEQIHQKNKTIEEYQNQNKELVKWIKAATEILLRKENQRCRKRKSPGGNFRHRKDGQLMKSKWHNISIPRDS